MNHIPCDSMGHDKSSLWRYLGSLRPKISALGSKISLICCFTSQWQLVNKNGYEKLQNSLFSPNKSFPTPTGVPAGHAALNCMHPHLHTVLYWLWDKHPVQHLEKKIKKIRLSHSWASLYSYLHEASSDWLRQGLQRHPPTPVNQRKHSLNEHKASFDWGGKRGGWRHDPHLSQRKLPFPPSSLYSENTKLPTNGSAQLNFVSNVEQDIRIPQTEHYPVYCM